VQIRQPREDPAVRMFSDLLQLNLSASVVLFGIFPVIIIALGIAYAVKQWRERKRDGDKD
jgi:hypothetical protein